MPAADQRRGKQRFAATVPKLATQYGLIYRSCFHLVLVLLYGSLGLFDTNAVAQNGLPAKKTAEPTAPTRTSESFVNVDQSPQTEKPGETQEETNKKKKESRGAIVAAPIPISSPAIGSGVVLVGGYAWGSARLSRKASVV